MAYQLKLNTLLQKAGPGGKLPDTYACALTNRIDKSLQNAFSGTTRGK